MNHRNDCFPVNVRLAWLLSLSMTNLYRCKVCPLTFFNKSEMQMHSKSHTEAKPHKCPHCSKSFANASYLAQHLRIHLGIKPYHCSYCENSFRQLSHLQQHTRSVILIKHLHSFPNDEQYLKVLYPGCLACHNIKFRIEKNFLGQLHKNAIVK